ncbi:archaetidylserine decarboxylase [Pendulispora brunnea]|uniref:phosphatidylserine decarboxylase n=1 Tax=Pendulispora brunnea TaxID=2905690 RepID=A0ABZ2KN49_9BACT
MMSALTFATAQLLRVLPRAGISRVMGKLADHSWSSPVGRAVVGLYSQAYGISLDECTKTEGWSSFDEFFTRTLRDGVRPIDPDPRTVVSPADGRLDSIARVEPGRRYLVKGRPYSVDELVGDAEEAKRFEGGGGCVVYLSPRDYHRVHAPVGGVIRQIRSLPGDYYPVNAIGMKHVPNLFVRNRRVAISIDTPPETGLGRVTVVMVVAIVVGRITVTGIDARDVPLGVHTFDPPLEVKKGDEIGIFHLGSTCVMFLEPAAFGFVASEGPVLYGQSLSRGSGLGATDGVPAIRE